MMCSANMINAVSTGKLCIVPGKSVNTGYQNIDLLNLEEVY